MKYVFDGKHYTLRFETGESVVAELSRFVQEHDIKGAWVKGLGGLADAEVGFYDLSAREYHWKKFDEPLELTNLTGNIAWADNEPVLHLHATVSDKDFHAYGGHLKEAEVGGTVEVMIHAINSKKLLRIQDEQTGLKLLDL